MTDRQKALEWFRERRTSVMMSGAKAMYNEAVKALEELEKRGEGKWIQYDKRFPWVYLYKCSKCGNYLNFAGVNGGRGEANYCPNCGAKMTEDKT